MLRIQKRCLQIFKIDLTKIDGLEKVLEHAALSDITAEEKGINIEALLNV